MASISDPGQDLNHAQFYGKRAWSEKCCSDLVSNNSLWCQAPPAHVSSLRPAPPASIDNNSHSNMQPSSSSLVVQLLSPTPRAADKPKSPGASFFLQASAKPKLSGAAQACVSGHGTASSPSNNHLRVWRAQSATHPGNEACRAKLWGPTGAGPCLQLNCCR